MHRRPVRLGLPPMALPAAGCRRSRTAGLPATVSVTSSGNGQVSPDASKRRIVNRTVEGAVPTRRAISRLGIPADFNLITSRTWRIASLSVGIQVPLRKAERRDRIGARRGLVTPGDIIPEWWARSSRNGGRDQIGTVGEIIPEWWATSSGISTRHAERLTFTRWGGTEASFPCRGNPQKLGAACPKRIAKKSRGSWDWRSLETRGIWFSMHWGGLRRRAKTHQRPRQTCQRAIRASRPRGSCGNGMSTRRRYRHRVSRICIAFRGRHD